MSELDEFMRKTKPKRKSKLADYNKEIVTLKKNKYTIKQIHSYLTSVKKVEVNMEYMARHIRNLDIEMFTELEPKVAAKPEPKAKVAATVPAKAEQIQEPKAETKEDILSSIGAALKKTKEESNGRANVEDWAPAS